MATKCLQLELNSNIYDKVIAFISKLPKNKIKLTLLPGNQDNKDSNIFLETSGLLSSKKIDPVKWQKEIRSEWDDCEIFS